jgi:FtsH-binding integral membrane protein
MPFTFSHPAVVLPFCKTKRIPVSVTGLVIGSMVPDFEFLFQLQESDYVGHSWPGILLFNLPAALLAAFIFHVFIRNSLILHLPAFIQNRFTKYLSFNWRQYFRQHYALFFICVMAGASSHVFIDSFTHKEGFIAVQSAFFHKEILLYKFSLPVYFILQLATSGIGILYTVRFVWRLKKEKSPLVNSRPVLYWLVYLLMVTVVLVLRFIIKQHNNHDDIVIACAGSLLYALLLTSFFFPSYLQKQPL